MRIESLSHLADSTVEQQLSDLVATDRGTTARMLHHLAECQARKTVWNDRLAVVGSCRSRTRGTPVADRPPRSIAG